MMTAVLYRERSSPSNLCRHVHLQVGDGFDGHGGIRFLVGFHLEILRRRDDSMVNASDVDVLLLTQLLVHEGSPLDLDAVLLGGAVHAAGTVQ